jgi:hypothetical protein
MGIMGCTLVLYGGTLLERVRKLHRGELVGPAVPFKNIHVLL